MSRTAKLALALVAALGVVAGGYYWLAAREIAVRTVPVQTGVEVRVFGIGSVEAQLVSKVGFQVAGKLVQIKADQGDLVKAGGLLAKLDNSVQRAKLMKSEVAVRQAEANLTKAQAQGERANSAYKQKTAVNARRQSLVSRGTVAQEAADDTQAGEEMAHADLRVTEADAAIAAVLKEDAQAQRQIDAVLLEQHELRAPFDARVVVRHKELGSVFNPGEAVFTLIAANRFGCARMSTKRWPADCRLARPRLFGCVRSPIRWSKQKSFASTRKTTESPRNGGSMCAAAPVARSTSFVFSANKPRSRS